MKVGKAIYNILSKSTDVQSNFPYNNTDYSPTGTELVENGEFDQLGTDVITNGGFATDTDWTKGNGWSIAGKAISTQALGSEEVTNGDFSAAGINLVDNPNFTDGTEEVTYPNFTNSDISQWVMNSGRAAKTWDAAEFMRLTFLIANGQAMYAVFGNTLNVSYKVTMRVRGTKSDGTTAQGSSFFRIGDNATIPATSIVSNPTLTSEWQDYEFYIVPTTTTFRFYLASAAVGDLVDFDSISVKELGADWTIVDNDATRYVEFIETGARFVSLTTSPILVFQQTTFQLLANTSYKLTVDMTRVSGGVKFETGGVNETFSATTSGTNNTRYITPTSNVFLTFIRSNSNTDLTFHSISVQELGEGWTLGTGWSIGEDKAIATSTGGILSQSISFVSTKNYKLTYDIVSNSGDLFIQTNVLSLRTITESGSYVDYFTTTTDNILRFNGKDSSPFDGSVTNVSVKEIATSYLTQAVSLSAKTWKIIYSVSDYIAGSVSATDYGAVTTANAVGITEYVQIGVASDFRMVNIDGYFEGAATDISAQLVDPNGYWTLGSGWSFGDDVAISDGSAGSITQSILTANTSYKITVKVTGNPTLLVFSSTSFYGDEATRTLKNGTHTYYLQAKAATFSITNEGGDACTVTNISVQEVVLNKIFPELAPPDIDAPYIVYSVVSNSPSETKNNNGDIDTASIEVYGFQDTYNKAVDLGVSVRAALDRKTGTYNTIEIQSTNYVNEQMDVNEARKLWAAIQDYSIRIKNL